MRVVQQRETIRLFERFGFNPFDVDLDAIGEAAVIQRFVEALVRILVADVLADDVDRQLVERDS